MTVEIKLVCKANEFSKMNFSYLLFCHFFKNATAPVLYKIMQHSTPINSS